MATTDCRDCNLREYLTCWLVTSSPFWLGLIIILVWVYKLLSSRRPNRPNGTSSVTQWLEPNFRSYRDVIAWLVLHCAILVMQLVEGYWILTTWWRYFTGYWNWKLKKSQWGAQLWQTVALVLLAVVLVGLLLAGFLLVLFAVGSIIELWLWKPKVEVEDAILDQCHKFEKDIAG